MEPDLSIVPVEELDKLWSELMQREENASESWRFYERQMQEGGSVSLFSLERAQSSLASLEQEERLFVEEWKRRSGWSRVFVDSYGSLHRQPACGKSKPHQHPQLLPALSGWGDQQVIEHAGLSVCLRCFPKAENHPVYKSALRKKRQERRCPGSTRKLLTLADGQLVCPVCERQVETTPKGRARSHSK